MFATRNLHAPILDVLPAASTERSVAGGIDAAQNGRSSPTDNSSAVSDRAHQTQSVDTSASEIPARLTLADMASDDLTGHSIGQYALGRKLGAGGMGRVFFARHKLLNRLFAIKFIAEDVASFAEAARRFDQEITALGKLQHPNIVNAVDAGCLNGMKYLVTELVVGADLGTLTWRHGTIPVATAAELVRQAAVGLSYSHRQGFLHRDIKPSNLILDESGTVKLLDFGLVRNAAIDQQLTANGDMLGTLDFVAPEQAHDASSVDERSDIYSLGCTLLFLLTGDAPFNCKRYSTPASKLKGHLFDQPDAVARPRASWPVELVQILSQMLEKSPAERFQTAAEVAAALAPLAAGADLAALHKSNPLVCEHERRLAMSAALDSRHRQQSALHQVMLGSLLVAAVGFAAVASTLSQYLGQPETTPTPVSTADSQTGASSTVSAPPIASSGFGATTAEKPTGSAATVFVDTVQPTPVGPTSIEPSPGDEHPVEPTPLGDAPGDEDVSDSDIADNELFEESATTPETEASPQPVQPAELPKTPRTTEPTSTSSAKPVQFDRSLGFPVETQPSFGKIGGVKTLDE